MASASLLHPPTTPLPPHRTLEHQLAHWRRQRGDLWVFGYASLIWRPGFAYAERRPATVHGWHRALKMWSRVNRGTPDCPGLVFAMLPGGSCRGMAYRIERAQADDVLQQLWQREMPLPVYDPRWLACQTAQGSVQALAFTLSRSSPSHTGVLRDDDLRRIFGQANGIYGSTRDYAEATHAELERIGIHDRALQRVIAATRPTNKENSQP
ncbi:gamma-glutamylcyclotransferase [Comamonas faecalis]